jgi:Tfp pilus assembly protein PilF
VFWRDQPFAAVRLTLKKGYYLLNGFEIPSLRSMYVDGAFSPVARALVWVHGVAFPAGLVIPLALLGLVLPCERSGATRLIRWALGACALVVVVFFVNSRFRAPLIAIAVVPAGHALAALGRALRTRSAGKLGPWLALLAALILFCNSDYFGVRDVDSAAQASILGSAYQEAGDLHSAAAWFGEAVLARPESVVDRHNLGVALQRLGRAHEAVTQLRRAVELSPGHAVVHNSLGTALEAANRIDESISHYNEAIRLDPDYAPARINLAVVHYHRGDFVAAWKNLQLLITNGVPVDPSFVEIVRARLQDESGATSRPGAPTTSRPG